MKVRAIRLGYYNHRRRREGDIFELLDDKAFSEKWMEKLDGKKSKVKSVEREEQESQSPSEEVI